MSSKKSKSKAKKRSASGKGEVAVRRLRSHGYNNIGNMTVSERRDIIREVVRKFGKLEAEVALSNIIAKTGSKTVGEIAERDWNWLVRSNIRKTSKTTKSKAKKSKAKKGSKKAKKASKKSSKKAKKSTKSRSRKAKRSKSTKAKKSRGCAKGTIRRSATKVPGFTRADGTRVKGYTRKASCVKDRGLPGKTPKSKRVLPALQKGSLSAFGYQDIKNKTAQQRHRALRKAVNSEGASTVIRKLTVLANYNRNANPRMTELVERDARWIRRTFNDNGKAKRSTKSKRSTKRNGSKRSTKSKGSKKSKSKSKAKKTKKSKARKA